jgi:hypothetical protein
VDELRLFVKPVYYAKIHNKVASLTGIHNRDLAEKGVPFSEAYDKFITWCGNQYAFMTWSMSDLPILIDNMILHNLDISIFPVCYDIQRIFGREIMRSETRYSLETALSLGISELVEKNGFSFMELISRMSYEPAKMYGLEAGYIEEKGPADLILIDPNELWKVEGFASKSQNSPFLGKMMLGKVKTTICKGKIVYSDKETY